MATLLYSVYFRSSYFWLLFVDMKFNLDLSVPMPPQPIRYNDRILLVGSCFTEHIAHRLAQHRFDICSNPNGILFNPLSVADSLTGYLQGRVYEASDLYLLNELWHSWDHHTRFSHTDRDVALQQINAEQAQAAAFIRQADWVMITLGSAFQYYLIEAQRPVANNHRAPGQWFEKKLLGIEDITTALAQMLDLLLVHNPKVQVVFTISPVRHIRDGVIENNRSKARLIESVHELCTRYEWVHYFPAYEMVIDILRDHRYYDIDLVHPNFAATNYVWEQFAAHYFSAATQAIMQEVMALHTAAQHRPRFPQTQAHRTFCAQFAAKTRQIAQEHPYLDLGELLAYFEQGAAG